MVDEINVDVVRIQTAQTGLSGLPDIIATGSACIDILSGSAIKLAGEYDLVAAISDQRNQLDTVNAFADMLRNDDVEVKIVTLPFETESEKSIRSGEARGQIEPPRFVLRMVRKL